MNTHYQVELWLYCDLVFQNYLGIPRVMNTQTSLQFHVLHPLKRTSGFHVTKGRVYKNSSFQVVQRGVNHPQKAGKLQYTQNLCTRVLKCAHTSDQTLSHKSSIIIKVMNAAHPITVSKNWPGMLAQCGLPEVQKKMVKL
jgi:hypothetical protein